MHSLLARQLKRIGLDASALPDSLETWHKLLERVSQSYIESDQGHALLERSISLSSKEMLDLNEQLRRTSESQLTEERDRLRTVISSIGDGLCVVDPNWRILLLNPEGQRLWHLREDEAVGRPLQDVVSLSSGKRTEESIFTQLLLDEVGQGSVVRNDDAILSTSPGLTFPVSYVLAPIVRDGKTAGAVLVFRDVTDRKQAESARRHTENQLRRQQQTLLELTRSTIIQSGILEPALREITKGTATTLGVERVSVWFLNENQQAIQCRSLYQRTNDRHSAGAELQATDYPNYFKELTAECIIDAADAQTDSRTAGIRPQLFGSTGLPRPCSTSPCASRGKLVGVLRTEHIGPTRTWTLEEQQFGNAIANLISLALEAADRLHAERALRKSEGEHGSSSTRPWTPSSAWTTRARSSTAGTRRRNRCSTGHGERSSAAKWMDDHPQHRAAHRQRNWNSSHGRSKCSISASVCRWRDGTGLSGGVRSSGPLRYGAVRHAEQAGWR
ncbi:MAG: PAS domain S-box protein [Nitrospiraceae bacterium]